MRSASRLSSPCLAAALACVAAAPRAQVRFAEHDGSHIASAQPWGTPTLNAVAFGDLDGDGDVDMACAVNLGTACVCFNEHGGSFRRFVTLPAAAWAGARSVALADVDGDGDLDALFGGGGTAYGNPRPSVLYRNDGLGNFALSPTVPATVVDATAARFVDLDADGDPDLVLQLGYPQITVLWRNDGTGTFTDATTTMLPGLPSVSATPGDFDGDGDVDLLATSSSGNGLLRNDGSGVFALSGGWLPPASSVGACWHAADLDGDGDVDAFDWRGAHLNDGAGNFTRTGSFTPPPYGNGAWSAAFADFDGDGRLDVAFTDGDLVPYLLRHTGDFVFADGSATWFEAHARMDRTIDYAYSFTTAGDIDGDGDPDLITGGVEGRGSSSTTVGVPPTLFVNNNRQRFVDATRPAFPHQQHVEQQYDTIAWGDIDGDGDLDLSVDGLWRQDPAGLFGTTGPIGPGGASRFCDVDGDGDLDWLSLAGTFGGGQPRLGRNDGTGAFTDVTSTHLPVAGTCGGSLAFGDVDGDGDPDVVIGARQWPFTGNGEAPVKLWRNDGAGHFAAAAAQMPTTAVVPSWLELADLDGDGDLDLIGTLGHHYAPPSPGVLLFTNDGTGTFTDVTATNLVLTSPWYGVRACLRDADGDGDLDLMLDGATLRNDGAAMFTASTAPPHVAVADFDEDGALDLVRETGNGLQVGTQQIPWGWSAYHAATPCDVDGDGDLDLIVRCLMGPSYQWSTARAGLLYNLRRDLRVLALPRVGQEWAIEVRATGNGAQPTAVFVAGGFVRLAQPLAVAGFGRWQLEPTAMVALGFRSVANADTAAELSVSIPGTIALAGLELSTQALFVPIGDETSARFSAAVTHAILP